MTNQLTRIEELLEELIMIQRESTSEAVLERVDRDKERIKRRQKQRERDRQNMIKKKDEEVAIPLSADVMNEYASVKVPEEREYWCAEREVDELMDSMGLSVVDKGETQP